jgi:carbonic anhydrase
VELNIQEQVNNLSATSIIQRSWALHKRPHIHGWVYDLSTGIIKDLLALEPGSPIDPIYRYRIEERPLPEKFFKPEE